MEIDRKDKRVTPLRLLSRVALSARARHDRRQRQRRRTEEE